MIRKVGEVIAGLILGFCVFVILSWLWVAVPGIVFGAIVVVAAILLRRR